MFQHVVMDLEMQLLCPCACVGRCCDGAVQDKVRISSPHHTVTCYVKLVNSFLDKKGFTAVALEVIS